MKTNPFVVKILTAAASVLMLVAVSAGNAYAELVPGYELPGIVPASYPNFENTVKANVYADNWFVMYLNGKLAAVDSIPFIPHNVISVDLLPEYPMTIAVMARDNGDPDTGMEYDNSNIGHGGFILKFADGPLTTPEW